MHNEGKKHKRAAELARETQALELRIAQPVATGLPPYSSHFVSSRPQSNGEATSAFLQHPAQEKLGFVSSREGNAAPPQATTTSDRRFDVRLRVQGVVIAVSSAYTQAFCDALTQALQGSNVDLSGADLSQASVFVQIDIGNNAPVAADLTSIKVNPLGLGGVESQGRTRVAPLVAEPEPASKMPKLETSSSSIAN